MEKLEEITDLALKAGCVVCESSGETYRAEDTISIIGHSLGADVVEPYVTPTGIMLHTQMKNEAGEVRNASRIVRIHRRSTNLGKITLINEVSRFIALNHENLEYSSLKKQINDIATEKAYSKYLTFTTSALSSFLFTIMFSGSLNDALIASIISTVMRALLLFLSPLKLSSFITTVLASASISFCSGLFVYLDLPINFAAVNIGTIMQLLSGLAIVIAIRDIIGGDYTSGIGRAAEAFVVALSVSVGGTVGLMLFPSALDHKATLLIFQEHMECFFYASIITMTFAVMFQVKNKVHISLSAIAGGISWLLFCILIKQGFSDLQATFLGTLCAGLVSEIFALIFKAPSTVFLMPALITFVPGGSMYDTMYNAVLGRSEQAGKTLLVTISIAGCIALAIAFSTAIARLIAASRRKIYEITKRQKKGGK